MDTQNKNHILINFISRENLKKVQNLSPSEKMQVQAILHEASRKLEIFLQDSPPAIPEISNRRIPPRIQRGL